VKRMKTIDSKPSSLNFENRWVMTGIITGFIAMISYSSMQINYPATLKRIVFFSYGVFLIPFVIGLYHFFKQQMGKTVKGQLAVVFGIIGGVLVNLMAVVQNSIRLFMREYIANAEAPELKEQLQWILRGLESVQLGIDVSFDVFMLSSLILLSMIVYCHKGFGKIFGGIGFLLSVSTLFLNLYTFPKPPGYVFGQFWDFGPFCGIWIILLLIRITWLYRKQACLLISRTAPRFLDQGGC